MCEGGLSLSFGNVEKERTLMELYVWLSTYPNVMVSLLIELRKRFDGKAYIICPTPATVSDEERYKSLGIEDAFQICLADNLEDYGSIAHRVYFDRPEAIHLFGGFWGLSGKALSIYASEFHGKHAYVFTEKPSIRPRKHFQRLNKLVRKYYSKWRYYNAYALAASSIQGIFVTGKKGVDQLEWYGIPKPILFEAMYTHNDGDSFFVSEKRQLQLPVRFIYIGRFDIFNRGLDTLMAAVSKLKLNGWRLDLVGGYGDDAEKVINWCNSTENVAYIGEWESRDVVEKLANYDVCISPTRIDGWRIQINQAIIAGVGTITTTEAISDELIELSNTGVVIPPNNVRQLRKAILFVLNHPEIVLEWKRNAIQFRERISNETVGKYMYDVIRSCETSQGERPQCPWRI